MKGKPDPERDKAIIESSLNGNSRQAIAKYYQLTPERVRNGHGVSPKRSRRYFNFLLPVCRSPPLAARSACPGEESGS